MPEKGGLKADKILHILPKTAILSTLWSEGFPNRCTDSKRGMDRSGHGVGLGKVKEAV